jgi:hypothetical protein
MQDDGVSVSISGINMNNNVATIGKDIFLVCENLLSVVPSKFSFMGLRVGNTRGNSFFGDDETHMQTEEDLFFFFRQQKGGKIRIAKTGNDIDY